MGNLVFQATLGGQVNLVGPNTASTFNLNVPAVSSTISTTSGTETLTNKTLTTPVINGFTGDTSVVNIGSGQFYKDTSGNLGLGVTPSAWATYTSVLQSGRGSFTGTAAQSTLTYNAYYNSGWKYVGTGDYAQLYEMNNTSGAHTWKIAGTGTAGNAITFTQAMTLDASGNLGVGTTSPTQKITANGSIRLTGNSSNFNETGAQMDSYDGLRLASYISTGSAIQFLTNASGGNTAERARIDSSGNLDMTGSGSVGRSAGGSGIYFGTNAVLPSSGTALSDNSKSMGNASWRWSVIYAGTGTINTSDANLKQDEQSLTNAERNVATAIKGLIKTFRFKDAVAEKGDAARIHIGVMAQAVKAAFEAEGLDANRYALFCSDTWIDEETNEEKTRLGIRYEELLAFVIAAI